ncbi:unnamed protein product, partial [Meganyctiphanes norvegica]
MGKKIFQDNKQILLNVIYIPKLFQHIVKSTQKSLLPLVNTPLLDYTLDWLERCQVDEAIVYCKAQPHANALRQHCLDFGKHRGPGGLRVVVVASEDCCSLGDALRDLYEKSLLKDDFIIVNGDIVANLDLQDLLKKHKDRRTSDKSAIMTCVYVKSDGIESEDSNDDAVTLISDAVSNKILVPPKAYEHGKLSIPTEVVAGHSELQLIPCVRDPGIAICSEVIPSLFSDNFDYGTRESLVRGVIEQEELLGYSIFSEVVEGVYASRVTSLAKYQTISGEIVSRFAYPLVPEVSLTSHRIRYHYDPFTNNYWDNSAKFSNSSIGAGVVVGAGSEISVGSYLDSTIVGDHCNIGSNVKTTNAYIMNHIKVKENCNIQESFVGSSAEMLENVTLHPCCVMGRGVKVGPNITCSAHTRLMVHPPKDEFDDDIKNEEVDIKVCGSKGQAFIFTPEDDEFLASSLWRGREKATDEEEDDEDENDMEDDDEEEEEDHMIEDEDERKENEFKREVTDSLMNGLREKTACENIVLEINSSRHAYNISMEDVLTSVIHGILRSGENLGDKSEEELWKGVKTSIAAFKDVLLNYVKKPRDQIITLNAIEQLVEESTQYIPLVQKILYELNQTHEILDDQVVVHWYKKGGAHTAVFSKIKPSISRFIEWLEQEDSDDEDEDNNQ